MKRYTKPTINVEEFELNNTIAALSTNSAQTLDNKVDVYDWSSLFGNNAE